MSVRLGRLNPGHQFTTQPIDGFPLFRQPVAELRSVGLDKTHGQTAFDLGLVDQGNGHLRYLIGIGQVIDMVDFRPTCRGKHNGEDRCNR